MSNYTEILKRLAVQYCRLSMYHAANISRQSHRHS